MVHEDLDFTDQFDVELQKTTKKIAEIPSKKLFKQGTSLLIFCDYQGDAKVKIAIKDTSSDTTVFDHTVALERKKLVYQAHSLAERVLLSLTGDKGVCLSTLAYCKRLSPRQSVLCISDYACKQRRRLSLGQTVCLAPRWHKDELFYSQLTKVNNRLMVYNTHTKQHKVAESFPGLNMQPSFSQNGKKVVVCFSGGQGNSDLYLYNQAVCSRLKRRAYQRLTWNKAHNVSPSMLPDGNIVFCSDFQTGNPQVYHMDVASKDMTRLTSGLGYAADPDYCEKTGMIVYTRSVNKVLQLFTISLDDQEERQVTFGQWSKREPCWSKDGRYVVFGMDQPGKRGKLITQIAIMNFQSRKIRVLTRDSAPKNFPRWTDRKLWW
jgi:tol-pal system beta propeller repeat protein TolB